MRGSSTAIAITILAACGGAATRRPPPIVRLGAPSAIRGVVHRAPEAPRALDPAGVSAPVPLEPLRAPGEIAVPPAELDAAMRAAVADLRDPQLDRRPDADDALWRAAQLLQQAGLMKDARAVYLRLLKSFPQSPHIPDAFVAFGDYYLAQRDLAEARAFYDKAATFSRAPAYAYAQLQLARAALLDGHGQDALAAYLVLASTATDPAVQRAADAGAADAYAQVGRAADARAYFEPLDPDAAVARLEALARAYLAIGHRDDGLAILRDAIARDPDATRACLARALAVAADASASAPRDQLLAGMTELAASATDGCRGEVDLVVGAIAIAWHADAAADRATVARTWTLAAQVATTPQRRAAALRDRALVAWDAAEAARTTDAWIAAADAADAASTADPAARDLAERAADARHNAQVTVGHM